MNFCIRKGDFLRYNTIDLNAIYLKRFYLYLNLLALVTALSVSGQNDSRVITTGVPFLLITPDARSAGMGELGVATSADVYSQQWNPAKYVFAERSQGLGVSYTPYLSKLVDDIFILLAGVTGDLVQNTYKDFATENPFISPTLNIQQTDNQYNAFIGAKGKLASNIGYNFNMNYRSEKDKALYIQNQTQTDGTNIINNAYEAGNSFEVVYDLLKTFNVYGEINFEVSKEFQLAASADYSNYTTDIQLEAWNLPEIKAMISAEYRVKKWFAGTQMFFNGNTKDYVISFGDTPEDGVIVTNKSYLDLNFDGGYTISDRLSVFAKINNAIGDNYERFVNYPVQSFQILGGVIYKFDL